MHSMLLKLIGAGRGKHTLGLLLHVGKSWRRLTETSHFSPQTLPDDSGKYGQKEAQCYINHGLVNKNRTQDSVLWTVLPRILQLLKLALCMLPKHAISEVPFQHPKLLITTPLIIFKIKIKNILYLNRFNLYLNCQPPTKCYYMVNTQGKLS